MNERKPVMFGPCLSEYKFCSRCQEHKSIKDFWLISKEDPTKSKAECIACSTIRNKERTTRAVVPCPLCGVSMKYNSSMCHFCWARTLASKTGPLHPTYKTGRTINDSGYVLLSGYQNHPNCDTSGRIREHILVMTEYLGRPVTEHETVHHINTDRTDNRLENLQLRIGQHGVGGAYKCSDCGSDRIEPTLLADQDIIRRQNMKISDHSFEPDDEPESEHLCSFMVSMHSTCDHLEADHD